MSARVLLVSDIPDQASAYVAALVRDGYGVDLATSGREALGIVLKEPPDCAVIDLRLPDMTGWDLCRTLRKRDECRDVPLIVLTPDVSQVSAEESARIGCNAWLIRPSVAEDLTRTVRQVLNQANSEPSSADDALLGVVFCPACQSERVRATLRVSPLQYYGCRDCGFSWRVDVLAPVSLEGG